MKYFVSTILLLLSLPSIAAEGDTLYVSDVLYVSVRATGCSTCGILHRGLVSGTAVTDLGEEQDGWTRIRTPNGIEGWMPNQYLVSEQIARERVPKLESDLVALRAENGQLQSQIDRLLTDLEEAGLSIETKSVEGEDGVSRQPIMQISGDVISLNTQNQELLRRNQTMQHEMDILVAENERLADTRWRSWFVYGGLAVIAGAILSSLVAGLRKRRVFSEWG